jgi:localization factor PodJL
LPLSPAPTSPDTTYSIDPPSSSFFDPSTALPPSIQHPDATGSISQSPAPPRPQPPATNPDVEASLDPLLAGLGPELRVAVAGKNPAAEYELGVRCAEGRGVPQNMPEAIRWFGRSANAGFVPALFRLGSLYERGEGTKKNLQAARRYYLSAAGKGHAKAMHNLAVLYAEGIDGKPDYKVAAQWFRKAANHGVSDSQYNLAILYARGIGVETNLVESYRWFALAAAHGDAEAAKKRDEVAARLDPPGLTAAKLAAQTFVPEREPEEATSLRIPPGGWDRTPAAPSKPQRREPASTAR